MLRQIKKNELHSKCVNKILKFDDIYMQKFCLQRSDLFFPLKQNKFLHFYCNKLLIIKLKEIRKEQIEIFSKRIYSLFDNWKKLNLLLDCEKLNSSFNILYKLSGCNNELKNCILCVECKKLVNINYIEKHFNTCKISKCVFNHVDGRQCDNVKHSKKMHRDFLCQHDLISENICINVKKFQTIFHVNNIKKTNEILVFKTKNSLSYIHSIVQTYFKRFNVMSKNCYCFLKLHSCQCFRYLLNNCDIDLFLKRKDKTLHQAINDCNVNSLSIRKTISIINVDKNVGKQKFKDFSFLSSFRNNNSIKLIFVHNLNIDFK
jgi:hypothetical protein